MGVFCNPFFSVIIEANASIITEKIEILCSVF